LSDEPDIGESNIATIMLRLENGQKFSRRFRAQQTIQVCFIFYPSYFFFNKTLKRIIMILNIYKNRNFMILL